MHLLLALLVFLYLIWLALSMQQRNLFRQTIRLQQNTFAGCWYHRRADRIRWFHGRHQSRPAVPDLAIDERRSSPNAFHGANAMAAIFDNPTTINFVHRTLGILVFLAVGYSGCRTVVSVPIHAQAGACTATDGVPSIPAWGHHPVAGIHPYSGILGCGTSAGCVHPGRDRHGHSLLCGLENLLSVKPSGSLRIFAANTCCERNHTGRWIRHRLHPITLAISKQLMPIYISP